jgi:hypothetical protein
VFLLLLTAIHLQKPFDDYARGAGQFVDLFRQPKGVDRMNEVNGGQGLLNLVSLQMPDHVPTDGFRDFSSPTYFSTLIASDEFVYERRPLEELLDAIFAQL